MQKKIDIGKKAKISIVWKVKPIEYTKEKENNIKSLFAKKYNVPESNIIVEKQFNDSTTKNNEGLNSENIKSITDPVFQHNLFKQYLLENDIKDYDFDEIVKIDSIINNLIDYDQYENGKRYTVKWLDWSNFLSYGKVNHFDFTQLHGLVLLNGEPANKSGKSTFAYDLLHFLFFGETKSGKGKNDSGQFNLGGLFNSFLPEETELKVEGCINIDGQDYIIRRTLKRPAKSKKELRTATQKIEYFRVNELGEREELVDYTNLQEESSTKTNKIIKEAIGNEKDFDLIISANAKDLDELISLKNDERGKLLSRWIGLSCLEDKNAKAREMWNKTISVGRYCDLYSRETLKQEIDAINSEIIDNDKTIESDNKKINECTEKIDRYNSDKERYLSEKKPIDTSIDGIGDVTTLETQLNNIVIEGKNDTAIKQGIIDQINAITDYTYSDEEYKSLSTQKDNLIESISTIKANINSLKEKNKQLESSEYCPTCGRKFENIDNSGLIKENKDKIEKLIAEGVELNNTKTKLIEQLNSIDQKRINYNNRNKLEIKLSAIETKIVNGRLAYKEIKDKIKKLNDNKEAIKYNDELDAKIKVITETLKVENSILNDLNKEVLVLSQRNIENKKSIDEKNSIIIKINNEEKIEKNWKLYLTLIGKDGISKIVLRNTLPIINAEINRLLTGVSDFEVEVTMNDKNDVNFVMIRNGVRYNLSAASGLEKTQAALALRVVLGNMSSLNQPPFILLDEILGSVAEVNYDDMKKLFDKIVKNYDFVLHICHINLGWEDMVLTVKKENNISQIAGLTK